jgi:hypothetical protein
MQIQALKNGTPVPNSIRHVERREGEFLIAAGVAIVITARRAETCVEAQARVAAVFGDKRTEPRTVWSIRPAQVVSDQSYPNTTANARALNFSNVSIPVADGDTRSQRIVTASAPVIADLTEQQRKDESRAYQTDLLARRRNIIRQLMG